MAVSINKNIGQPPLVAYEIKGGWNLNDSWQLWSRDRPSADAAIRGLSAEKEHLVCCFLEAQSQKDTVSSINLWQ